MAAESPMKTPTRLANGALEDFERDLEALLEGNQYHRRGCAPAAAVLERERDLNVIRSGSAPPTVEGARSAAGSLFGNPDLSDVDLINGCIPRAALTEEEMRSHPAYLRYYYSNENLNPRLPPPALSREDRRVAQRFQVGASAFGRIGDRRKEIVAREPSNGSSGSLFSLQPGLPPRDVDGERAKMRTGTQRNLARHSSAECGSDDPIGRMSVGLGTRKKSFADALQEGCGRSSSVSGHHMSGPVSRNAFDNVTEEVRVTDADLAQLQDGLETAERASSPSLVRAQSLGSSVSHSFASVLGSSRVRSTTPDPQIVGNYPSPHPPALGAIGEVSSNGAPACIAGHHDIAVSLSGLNISKSILVNGGNDLHASSLQEFADNTDHLFNVSDNPNDYLQHKNTSKPNVDSLSISSIPMLPKMNGVMDTNLSKLLSDGHISLPNGITSANIHQKIVAGSATSKGSHSPSQNSTIMNADFSGGHLGSFPMSQRLPTSVSNQLDAEGRYPNCINKTDPGIQAPLMDPLFIQYLQQNDSAPSATAWLSDSFPRRNVLGISQVNFSAYQKAALEALLAEHKLHYGSPFLGKSGDLNHGYYGTGFGLGMQFPANPTSVSIISSLGMVSPPRQGERFSCFPSMMRRSGGGSVGSWNSENSFMGEGFASSLLEEFKSSKTRSFELSEIVGHVVEFSADQHGSRFIQQKLETASADEKNVIFPEILPHARALMTDVFGNYVIQKFFEHGTESQRKQLASQLTGHVLPLSLQMYGCRVIQKALEVVDVDQQTQMVLELDGSVMKCVRDQNGNHVIQKCIECVPQERIQFIISAFYGQVVPLSTHPYGCRVIQRVLEHCDDAKTQTIVMDEILQAVCTLAQDQYGNYVIQHLLQHGKQQERSAIISKLAGQIVKMSQQKFASNVVEKCLTYGMPEERQLLINEILGSTDENEPLQAMMKDQFGNYVVQKVLETCDNENRELILSRIKAHVNALKKYTYGKHIAARVEKVIAAGERHMGMPSNALCKALP